MIERAVASLESGQLQRAIPKTRRAARRSRQLHTGFWQHGAATLELSSFWSFSATDEPPSQDAAPTKAATATEALEPKLVATSFLLDFLYPNDTQSFLHRMLAPRPKANRLRPLRRRQYSAQQMAAFQRSEPSILCTTQFHASGGISSDLSPEHETIENTNSEALEAEEASTAQQATAADALDTQPESTKPDDSFLRQFNSRVLNTNTVVDDAWSLYQKASREEQLAQRAGLILSFAKTDEYVECARAAALFREIPQKEWTDELLSAAIRSLAVCGKFNSALKRFKEGLRYNYTSGMQYIVASAFGARQWQDLFQVWFNYSAHMQKHADKQVPFDHLPSIPKLDTLFSAFEKHIKYTGLAQIRLENKEFYSRERFDKLRHLMIRSVLAKPCQPNRAKTILSHYDNIAYYQLYIESVLRSIKAGKQSKVVIRQLAKMYCDYRQRPGAQFTPDILRGMFNIYYPNNPSGLALLYQDWIKSEAGLDEWAYQQFLAFYAKSGDIHAVRDLWQRYITAFPAAAKEARGYHSLVDAYAQSGDVSGAEQELVALKQSGIEADVVLANALLKCYVRAGRREDAKACFEAILEQHGPTVHSFEHMMELHSSNGDLEQTLAVFNRAQAAMLPSVTMATALVVAYLHNDLIQEAEQICREMARRGVTSTEIWNRLIQAYATAGMLDKCFQLLPAMQSNNLAWDHDTCLAVLAAQGQAKQTAAAHRLLRSAVADNLLPITANHFAIVMNSAISSEQAPLVDILSTEMERAGIQPNFATHLARFESGFVRAATADRTARLAKSLVHYMRKLAHNTDAAPGKRQGDAPYTPAKRDVAEINKELHNVADALKLLIDKREMALAEELVTLYAKMRPVSQHSEHMPSDVLSIIMGAYLAEGRHARVLQLWSVLLRDVRRRTENPATKTVFPVHAYHLSGPIAHVAQVYRAAGDGKRLLACTQAALDAGFQFTRATWNTLISCLAALGQWEAAMYWCETLLMPRWRGWTAASHRRLTLAERHELTSPRVLVASESAVLSLQREWLRLRKLAAWSAGVTAKLQRIETQYPLLHQAFITVDVADLPDTWAARADGDGGAAVGEKRTSLNKAIIEDALGAVGLKDLLAMRLTLGAQWHAQRERQGRKWAKKWGQVYVPPKGKRRRF